MPLYEYHCAGCGKTFEIIQKFSEPPLKSCPNCQSLSVTKVMSRSSFQLKGGGWYASDYKKPASSSSSVETATTKNATSSPAKSGGKKGSDS